MNDQRYHRRTLLSVSLSLIGLLGYAQADCNFSIDSLESGLANTILDSKAIARDSFNNYYITGSGAQDTIIHGGETIAVDSGSIFLIKFNEAHDIQWVRKGSSHEDAGSGLALAVDNEGNVLIGGFYESALSFGDTVLTSVEGASINSFIAKFTSTGDHLWSSRIHTPGHFSNSSITSLASDPSGNVFFGGFFTDTLIIGQDSLVSYGQQDNFWGKLDPDGNILWARASVGQRMM